MGWLWLVFGVAAADDVRLAFVWPAEARWSVVELWRCDPLPGAQIQEGVVRSVWHWARAAEAATLRPDDVVVVRTLPNGEVPAPWTTPWVLMLSPDLQVVRPLPELPKVEELLVPPPEEPAPMLAPDVKLSSQGAPPAAAPEPATMVPPPVAEVMPVDPALLSAHERLFGDPLDDIERGLLIFDGQSLPVGRLQHTNAGLMLPSTGQVEVAEVELGVSSAGSCPDLGPGSACVTLEVSRSSVGAHGDLQAGQWRVVDRWVVEPGTMTPHSARREVQAVASDGSRWSGERTWRFLPGAPSGR